MIKTLAASVRDYKKVAIATPLLVLGEVACEVSIPFVTANLIDTIKDGRRRRSTSLPTAGLLVASRASCSLAFGAVGRHHLQPRQLRLCQEPAPRPVLQDPDVQLRQHRRVLELQLAGHAPHHRHHQRPAGVHDAHPHRRALPAGAGLRLRHGLCHGRQRRHGLHWSSVPLLGFGLFYIIHLVRPIFARVFHKYDALNESVEENVAGMRVVKSYVREESREDRSSPAPPETSAPTSPAPRSSCAFNNPMMNICVNGAFVAIIYLGSKIIITTQGTAVRRRASSPRSSPTASRSS